MDTSQKNLKNNKAMEQKYIDNMDDKEKQAYLIAKKHLESSFSLKKSIGFTQYVSSKK